MNDNYNGILQTPLHSGFNEKSSANEVARGVDLRGRTAIVTGGYAGIGLETVKTFSEAGAKIIVPARDIRKATMNLSGIKNVQIEKMDLMNPQSIEFFSKLFLDRNSVLDILVNNAGIMWVPMQRDPKGYESQLSTNHLGHFLLTARLWPALKNAKRARVINVSSFGHQIAPFDFEDPHFINREYETLTAYGQSKTANNLFTVELDHRAKRRYRSGQGGAHGFIPADGHP
jgi:NAD(P)-dependent dehydrogenase (short-subunit alcohol dehydrogenase family)